MKDQQAAFASGRMREAIEALDAFAPPHPMVTAAVARMREERADIQRRAAEEAARQQREAAEAARRREAQQQWIARELELARSLIGGRQFREAIGVLQYLAGVAPGAPDLNRLIETARSGQAAVEAEIRREREIEEKLADAERARAGGDLAGARSLLDGVLEAAPGHVEATARRRQVDAELAARARADAADRTARAAADAARRQFDAGHRTEAIAALAAFSPPHDIVARAHSALLAELVAAQRAEAVDHALAQAERALTNGAFSDALRALEQAETQAPGNSRIEAIRVRVRSGLEEQQRAQEHARRASAAVSDARARFAARDAHGALKLLEQFSPPHAVTSEALSQLRAELAVREEEQRRLDEEQRRRAEEERAARVELACEKARVDIAHGRFADALERLNRLEHVEGQLSRVRALMDAARVAQTAADDERRAKELDLRARAAAADARQLFAAGDEKGAVALLTGFSPSHAIATDALRELRARMAANQQRRRAELRASLHRRFATPARWFAVLAAVLLVIGGVAYLLRGLPGAGPRANGSGHSTADATARIVAESEGRLRSGDFSGATRELVAGLGHAPGDSDLQRALQDVLQTAGRNANSAKQAADAARASSRPEYVEAASHLQSADKSRASGRPKDADAAVGEYAAAERLFNDAARSASASADGSEILGSSRRLLAANDLTGAAHEIVAGLRRDPDNHDFRRTLDQIFGAAEDRANTAKRVAAGSEHASASAYRRGTAQLAAAAASRRSARLDDAEPAVRSYLAAADAFMAAANDRAHALLQAGDLVQAAHVAVAGLTAAPDQPDLRKTLQQTLDTAASQASAARQSADSAGAAKRTQYAAAVTKLDSANGSKTRRSYRPDGGRGSRVRGRQAALWRSRGPRGADRRRNTVPTGRWK